MKVKNYLTMLLVALCAISCSDDDDAVNPSDVIAGTYSGYSWASFFGGSNTMLGEGESVSLTANADGTVGVSYTSGTWGTTTISAATVATGVDGYTLSGTGSAVIGNHNTGSSTTYECTFTGTVSADKSDAELTFTLPAVMNGTTITFHTGSAPDYMAVNGTYTVYTVAQVMGMSLVSNGETIKLTADTENEAAVLSYSGTWGTGSTTALTLTKTNGDYTFSGSGSIAASMSGTTNAGKYDFTVEGTLSADKTTLSATFSIALGGMGTVIVKADSGYAPATSFLAGTYEGYTSTVFSYSPNPMIADGESVTITGNDDGTLNVVLTSSQWGKSTISNATVEVSEEGVYTLSGEGSSLMGMSGSEPKEYPCTLSGTVSADKEDVEISISLSIMGGTTITFHPGEAPAEEGAE